MKREELIKYWLELANDDLEAASDIYKSKRYDWSLFILHLATEKLLKAFYIYRTNELIPPYTHNLLKLAELSKFELNDEDKKLFSDINKFNINARYPDYKQHFRKIATKDFADYYFLKIEEIFKWIKSQIQ